LVDIDPVPVNLNPSQAEAAIKPRTKAIVPVHFDGQPCDLDVLCATADKHGLTIMEDCAHAIETEHSSRHAGTSEVLTCFSFFFTNNVVTVRVGIIVTDRKVYDSSLRLLPCTA